ncbi:PhzF family phenazine biosynthesis protein [Agaribacterium haliotis]|uniref:PhzF family phenazine biosynthesis protein n=1 Tax=Agaribacterium haliotis TaxID=2013869 RepID=UPI000BB57BCF|nr:PhzF family phenazine biosynthesis protein [Agaribacterium haliotis]
MTCNYLIIDAFSEVAFGGVPVAVFANAGDIPPVYFKALAEELVPGDTVFIDCIDASNGHYSFQFYNEFGPCHAGSHTIIAGLAALKYLRRSDEAAQLQALKIETTEDCFEAYIDGRSSEHPFLWKQSVSAELDQFVPELAELAAIIGLDERALGSQRYQSLIVNSGKPYLLVPVVDHQALREAHLQTSAWEASSLPGSLVDRILLHAPSAEGSGADFHCRLLRRGDAAHADPAVGEAMPAFAAYLCAHEHVKAGTHSLSVLRGDSEARQSFIHLEFDKDSSSLTKLRTAGAALVCARGEILAM